MKNYLEADDIREFLRSKKAREMMGLAWCFGFDNNQNFLDAWETSKLKVLVVFLSPGTVRAVSNTYTQLDALIRQIPDVFVDYCYYPAKDDIELYEKNRLPFMFGNVSQHPSEDYDLIFHSHSILVEFINAFHSLSKSGVPCYHNERIELSYPLIVAGGIPIQDHDGMGGKSGVPDVVYSGQGEGGIPKIIELFIRAKDHFGEVKSPNVKRSIIKKLVTTFDNIYYPNGYEVIYDGAAIKSITTRLDWVPDKVHFHSEFELDQHPGFENKIFTPDGSNATSSDMVISAGCSGSFMCNFCAEGNICGGWREKSLDRLRSSMDDTLLRTACNTISFYSFNLSYYSAFIDLIWEAALRFKKLSLINMRVDQIAEAPEYFEAAHALGIRRASAPIEGYGERIRNKIYNKALSREQIMKAFRTFYSYGIMEIKCGMVLSGLETEEDWKDAIDEFEEILRIRDEMGSTAGLRTNSTPLVVYPKTALQGIKQVTAYNSLYEIRTMREVIQHFRGRIRFKFNGQHKGTFVEQMTLNMGRLGTPIWEKIALEHNYSYYGSPGSTMPGVLIAELSKLRLKPEDWFHEKPDDWIYPTQFIVAKKEDYFKKSVAAVGVESIKGCTKNRANPNPKCGDCGFCKTKEQKLAILTRDIKSTKTTTDIQEAMYQNKAMSASRVVFRMLPIAYTWNKKTFSHVVASRILQTLGDPSVFHSLDNYSNAFLDRDNMLDRCSGFFFFDIRWKTTKAPEINIKDVNKLLRFLEITHVKETTKNASIMKDSPTVYEFTAPRSYQLFIEGLQRWKGKVRVTDKAPVTGYDVKFTEVELSLRDFNMYLRIAPAGVKGVLVVPLWVNPYCLYQTLFGVSYKVSLKEMNLSMFSIFDRDEGGMQCKMTGCKETTRLNMSTFEPSPVCLICLAKVLLKKDTIF